MKQKDYLNKVVEQLVSETTIEGRVVWVPYSSSTIFPSLLPYAFDRHCRNVYGLTEEEVKYVWKQYTDIINSRI
jgi:hypothetical protein